MKCRDCAFLDKVEWVGDMPHVFCRHPFYVPDKDIDPEQGCPFGNRAPAPKKKKGPRQQTLF